VDDGVRNSDGVVYRLGRPGYRGGIHQVELDADQAIVVCPVPGGRAQQRHPVVRVPHLRLLLPAGVETTYRSLGNLLFALLSDPAQLNAVRADRSLLPQAIEEAVRWEPPLLTITRVATRDTELGGVPIPAGSTVMPMLGAANRQEDRYPDPDTFDIFRAPRAHLGWGHGVHVCLGMHLARLEMRTAVNLLLDRLRNLRLDPDGDDPHIRGQVFRSPTSLPVRFDPR